MSKVKLYVTGKDKMSLYANIATVTRNVYTFIFCIHNLHCNVFFEKLS